MATIVSRPSRGGKGFVTEIDFVPVADAGDAGDVRGAAGVQGSELRTERRRKPLPGRMITPFAAFDAPRSECSRCAPGKVRHLGDLHFSERPIRAPGARLCRAPS